MILDPNRNTSLKLGKTSAGILAIVATGIAGAAFLTAPRLVLAEPQSVVEVREAPASSSDVFAARAPSSSKPDRRDSSIGSTSVHPVESVRAPVHANPYGRTQNEPRTQNRVRTRYGSSVSRNPAIVSSGSYSSVATLPELDESVSPRVVVVQSSSTVAPTSAVRAKPRAPKRPQEPALPPVIHVQTTTSGFDGHQDRSLEQRMEQLERKLAEMTAAIPRYGGAFEAPETPAAPGDFFGAEETVVEELPNPFGQEHQIAIEVDVEEANQQMVVAMKQVEIANQQKDRRIRKRVTRDMEIDARREALNAQKRSLEQQMRRLDRQMKELNNEVNSLEEQLHGIEEPGSGLTDLESESKTSF